MLLHGHKVSSRLSSPMHFHAENDDILMFDVNYARSIYVK